MDAWGTDQTWLDRGITFINGLLDWLPLEIETSNPIDGLAGHVFGQRELEAYETGIGALLLLGRRGAW